MKKNSPLKGKKVVVISNITDHSGPTEGLAKFVSQKAADFLLICHPFYYCRNRRSRIELFKRNHRVKTIETWSISLPEFTKYFFDFILTVFYFFRFYKRYDLYVGVNCFYALLGVVLRQLGFVKEVVFYGIDWMPYRFQNSFFNRLYFWIDRQAIKHVDFVWNLSEEMVNVRQKQGVPSPKNMLVPNGVNFSEIKMLSPKKIKRNVLVLLGALHESKGVELIIQTMPKIWKKFPEVKLEVIGSTPFVPGIPQYEKILKSLGSRVNLRGILSHVEVLELLPGYGVGLSPYSPEETNLSRYAWPARVIDYLACGLPVVITPVPAVAQEIAKKKAGILIKYRQKELLAAVEKLLSDDDFYWRARRKARAMVRHLDWENIFKKAFEEMDKVKHSQAKKQEIIFAGKSHWVKRYQLENFRISYLQRVFKSLKIPGKGKYLDIGCGSLGHMVLEAARVGQSAVGLDLSKEMVKKAEKFVVKELGKDSKTKFVVGQAEKLPFQDNTFTKVSAVALLEHIKDDEAVVKEMARVLKPGGKAFLTVPNDFGKLWPPYAWYYRRVDKEMGHLRHYDGVELAKRFKKYGLQLVELNYTGHFPKVLQYLVSVIWTGFSETKWWWYLEKLDFQMAGNEHGLHFDIVFKKND